jgi:LEA14-like dessication related protein
MAKKIFWTLLLILLLVPGILLLWRSIHYVNDPNPHKTFLVPHLEFAYFKVSELNREKGVMTAEVLVYNPLPFSLKADNVAYKFFIHHTEVMRSTYDRSINLAAADSSWIILPVTVHAGDLVKVLKESEREKLDSVDYELQADFCTNIIFRKCWNSHLKTILPLLHIPELTLDHVETHLFKNTGANLVLHASIFNGNVFPIRLRDMTYKLFVDQTPLMEGKQSGLIALPARQETKINLPLEISFKDITYTGFKLIKEGKKLNYTMELTMLTEAKNNIMDNAHVVIVSKGSLNDILSFRDK